MRLLFFWKNTERSEPLHCQQELPPFPYRAKLTEKNKRWQKNKNFLLQKFIGKTWVLIIFRLNCVGIMQTCWPCPFFLFSKKFRGKFFYFWLKVSTHEFISLRATRTWRFFFLSTSRVLLNVIEWCEVTAWVDPRTQSIAGFTRFSYCSGEFTRCG